MLNCESLLSLTLMKANMVPTLLAQLLFTELNIPFALNCLLETCQTYKEQIILNSHNEMLPVSRRDFIAKFIRKDVIHLRI